MLSGSIRCFIRCSVVFGQYLYDDEDELRKKKPRCKLPSTASITRANVSNIDAGLANRTNILSLCISTSGHWRSSAADAEILAVILNLKGWGFWAHYPLPPLRCLHESALFSCELCLLALADSLWSLCQITACCDSFFFPLRLLLFSFPAVSQPVTLVICVCLLLLLLTPPFSV